jgi:hypothetical protein
MPKLDVVVEDLQRRKYNQFFYGLGQTNLLLLNGCLPYGNTSTTPLDIFFF